MLNSAKIAELQNRISLLETQLKTATDGQADLQTQLDQAKTELGQAQAQVTAHATTITELKGQVTAAEERATAAEGRATAAEASISDQVNARLAAAGVDPVARDPQAKNPDDPARPDASVTPMKRAAAAMASKFGAAFRK